ncbi:unnamed protein product, partial [Gulo gulo]
AAGGGGFLGDSGVRRKLGKWTAGSGDLNSLTTEPNTIWNPGNQNPHSRNSPMPSSFHWRSSNEKHVCVLHPKVRRLQGEDSAPCKHFPSLGMCQGSPTSLVIWLEGPKGDTRRPRASHPAPHTLIPPVQSQVPSPCMCTCVCNCVCAERGLM